MVFIWDSCVAAGRRPTAAATTECRRENDGASSPVKKKVTNGAGAIVSARGAQPHFRNNPRTFFILDLFLPVMGFRPAFCTRASRYSGEFMVLVYVGMDRWRRRTGWKVDCESRDLQYLFMVWFIFFFLVECNRAPWCSVPSPLICVEEIFNGATISWNHFRSQKIIVGTANG